MASEVFQMEFCYIAGRNHLDASWIAFVCCHIDDVVVTLAPFSQIIQIIRASA